MAALVCACQAPSQAPVGEGAGAQRSAAAASDGSASVRPAEAPTRPVDRSPRREVPSPGPTGAPACQLVEPPPGFVDLAELLPSARIVAGYHRADNFTAAPLPGYEAAGAWLEREAAVALVRASRSLASAGYRLVIYDAYRPRRASAEMVAWARRSGRHALLEDGWIAARSAHNRGLAVDIGLADDDGEILDMGSGWDQFDRRSYLRGVGGEALERRLKLREAMVGAGFVPYAREWWHFSYRSAEPSPARDSPYRCR